MLLLREIRIFVPGCGQAKPSLRLCELREAKGLKTCVTLQDLNDEVLARTCSDAAKIYGDSVMTDLDFVVSDWTSMLGSMTATYDLILSSDTLYRPESFEVVEAILDKGLKSSSQVIRIAEKSKLRFRHC